MTAEIRLYEALVAACEDYGFLTDHSYDLIQSLISSLQTVPVKTKRKAVKRATR